MTLSLFRALLGAGLALLYTGAAFAEAFSREEALRLALAHHPEIAAARQEWAAARARAQQARALPDPELEVELEGLPSTTSPGDFEERNVGVRQQLGWPLEWWRGREAADAEAQAVRWSALAMTELDIAARAGMAFDRVLSGHQLVEYEEEHLQLARDFVDRSRLRFQAGDVPQLHALRAEVEAGRAATRLLAARSALGVARAELNTLMGRSVDAPLEVEGELRYTAVEWDLENARQRALEQRPELLGAEHWIVAERARHAAVRASTVPDLSVGLFRQTLRQPAGDENAWRVSVGVQVPLWAAFRQRGALAEAHAELARAQAEAEALRQRVLLEVEAAFRELEAAGAQVELFRSGLLREAEQARQAAGRTYETGKATYLEVLETQRALAETRVEYARALLGFNLARATLERAVGGSFSAEMSGEEQAR